ncbi:MAG: AgmX/PglI C-terminal domain-containing protein [Deltaproteobacteria bacterium]|nr:AgmX/PglI C-terminal domain-containing protein [Deltaproteobacteria bacterium]
MATLTALVTTAEGVSWLLACALRAALLLAAAGLGAALLRRSAAAARHQLWTLGVLGAVLIPILCAAVPSLAPAAPPAMLATGAVTAPRMIALPVAAPTAPSWPAWLAIAWATGALVVVSRLARGHLAARRLLRTATPDVPGSWTASLREAAASLAHAPSIELRRSETIGSPMTIGVWRPRVLLPAAAEGWAPARLRAVLVHELAHVRRRDTLVQLLAQLACALYWWNPLTWLAAARLRLEREHACDDLVLAAGVRPSSYAADLLDVARAVAGDAPAHVGAIGIVDRASTEARLRRILDATAPRRPLRARFRIATCAMALGGAATLACTAAPLALPPPTATRDTPAPPDKPTAPGTLSVGTPSVRGPDVMAVPVEQGEVDLALVAAEVTRRSGDLQRCYERRLAVDPALSGTIAIHWNLAATGAVNEACITTDTIGDEELVACVNQLILGASFPAPRGGAVDVTIPFVFTARVTDVAARSPGLANPRAPVSLTNW